MALVVRQPVRVRRRPEVRIGPRVGLVVRRGGLALLLAGCAAPAAPSGPPVALPPPPPPAAPLYGFWGLNGYTHADGFADLRARLGLTVFQVASEDPAYAVHTLLPAVRAAGLKVTLRLAGDHDRYTRLGAFDLAAWKRQLDAWRGAGLEPFVADGTLAGHMLLDDVTTFSTRDPDAAELDEMARYSHELFPALLTYVRQKATALPEPAGGRYRWLDAQVNQYEALEGPVEPYATAQAAAAERLGLGVINGLNIADGGDGSSGQPGARAGHWAMSADEITRYGAVLAAVPSCGMFLNWEYDADQPWADGTRGAAYFREPAREAALRALGERVAAHPPVSLHRAAQRTSGP